jgi:hypothetical protein
MPDKPLIVIVIEDGTIQTVYSDADVCFAVVEADLVDDGLCEPVWEPLTCRTKDLKLSRGLRSKLSELHEDSPS